jgi:hypothetical protein
MAFPTAAEHQRARNKWPTALERPRGGATPVAPGFGHEKRQSSFAHASTSTEQYTPAYAVDGSDLSYGIEARMQSGCRLVV